MTAANHTLGQRLTDLQRLTTQQSLLSAPDDGATIGSRELFNNEALLDAFLVLYDECSNPVLRRDRNITKFVESARSFTSKVKKLRLSRDDFETLKIIGKGAFGEVAVVKLRSTGQVYAMKILNKWEMLKRAETACFMEERDVLVYGDRDWITNLHFAFQDENYLYLVMDYYPGGDLLTLLSKNGDRLPEDMARFYMAEMVLALDSLHRRRYVHRDVKPDNVLIGQGGHIVLADFGSCLRLRDDGMIQSNVAVGTPDYISPEILRAMEDSQGVYGKECDWWSLGICMYEMLYGVTPFYAESLVETYGKIMNHKELFDFPPDDDVSNDAKDLMRRLVCSADVRFGQNGLDDFRKHPFFKGISWDNMKNLTPPFVPVVGSPTDTSNFDVDDEGYSVRETAAPSAHTPFTGHHLPFIGFTFLYGGCDSADTQAGVSASASQAQVICNFEKLIKELEQENKELRKKGTAAADGTKHGRDSISTSVNGMPSPKMRRAEDASRRATPAADVQRGLDRIAELERLDTERAAQLSSLERQHRLLQQESADQLKDFEALQVRHKAQTKELKEALSAKKLAIDGFSEKNEELEKLKLTKQKLLKQLHEKDEELSDVHQKLDVARPKLQESERERRKLEAKVEELEAEVLRKQKLHEREQGRADRLEIDLETATKQLRSATAGAAAAALQRQPSKTPRMPPDGQEPLQELQRLKSELDKLRHSAATDYHATRTSAAPADPPGSSSGASAAALADLQKRLGESEAQRQQLRSDLDNALREQRRRDEAAERDRSKLIAEIDALQSEMAEVQKNYEKSLSSASRLEEELQELAEKKEAVSRWEAQICEIIQWVSDEKDARGYLQALAAKMSEELDTLKSAVTSGNAGSTPGPGVSGSSSSWQARRSQRLEKMHLLDLQSSLKSEIEAKQAIGEELAQAKALHAATEQQLQMAEDKNNNLSNELRQARLRIDELESKLEYGSGHVSASGTDGDAAPHDSQMSFLSFINKQLSSSISVPNADELDSSVSDHPPPHATAAWAEQSPSTAGSATQLTVGYQAYQNVPASPSSSPSGLPVGSHAGGSVIAGAPKGHTVFTKTFTTLSKCAVCTSLMLGVVRQGLACESCDLVCHQSCAAEASSVCPVPAADAVKRPPGMDPQKGLVGTMYEGYLKVPKPGGIKKGWARQYVVVCDFKLFIYEVKEERGGTAPATSAVVSQVLDMRDEEFSVGSVLEQDVIHANRKDIPCIFRVTTSQLREPHSSRHQVLMLAETTAEKQKWVAALTDLHKVVKKNKLIAQPVLDAKEVYDSSLTLLRNMLSACIYDSDRLLVGTEEGLHVIETQKDEITKVGEKKPVWLIQLIPEEQLILTISGRMRHVRLLPYLAVEGRQDVEGVRVEEPRGATTACVGLIRQGSSCALCVAVKRTIFVYELTRTSLRHRKLKDIQVPGTVQFLALMNERLCVGYPSVFAIYSVQGSGAPQALVSTTDASLSFLVESPIEALCSVEISHREYLLVFQVLGVYVDLNGRRSRPDIMWPAAPKAFAYNEPHLLCFCEEAVFVFDTQNGEWSQTMCLKQARPLDREGTLTLALVSDSPRLVYLSKHGCEAENALKIPAAFIGNQAGAGKRRFSMKSREEHARLSSVSLSDRRSKLISAPSNFSHIQHMGPNQIKVFRDLPAAQAELAGNGTGAGGKNLSAANGRPTSTVTRSGSATKFGSRLSSSQLSPPQASVSSGNGSSGYLSNRADSAETSSAAARSDQDDPSLGSDGSNSHLSYGSEERDHR